MMKNYKLFLLCRYLDYSTYSCSNLNKLNSIQSVNEKLRNIDDNWIGWFIGFCDAEGNFQTFPKKRVRKDKSVYYNVGYGFHLGLHSRDKDLMNLIHSKLGYRGKVYEYHKSNKDEIHLAVTQLEELNWLNENLFDSYPLLTKHQWDRYCRLRYGVLNKINRMETLQDYEDFISDKNLSWTKPQLTNIQDPQFIRFLDNWISGFINGEGTFNIVNNKTFRFYIEQTENNVLTLIRERLACGPQVLERKQRGTRKLTWSLDISSKKDITRLIELFESNNVTSLQGYKYYQYKEWADKFRSSY